MKHTNHTTRPAWLDQVHQFDSEELRAAMAEAEARAGKPQEVIRDATVNAVAFREIVDRLENESD